MTARLAGSPLWKYIADSIAQEISDRVFAPGDRLPTELELAQRFGVNRHTVRRAVGALQDLGLIRIEQGRGTFVQEDVVDYPISSRTRFSEIIRRQAKTPSGALLRSAAIPADEAVSEALAVDLGAPVALIETVGCVDDQPISLVGHHFSLRRFPEIFVAYEAEQAITPMLARLGVSDYFRKSTRITARMPDGYEMRHLRMTRMTPILCLEAINVDSQGAPVEYGLTRFSSNRVQIIMDTLPL